MASETQTLFVLVMIGVIMVLLTANYYDWQNNLRAGCIAHYYDANPALAMREWKGNTSLEANCGGDIPLWFNAIWLAPLALAIVYAWTPFVKG